jgi:hypothetical protein
MDQAFVVMLEVIAGITFFLLFFILLVFIMQYVFTRYTKPYVIAYLSESNYKIITCKRAYFITGPFFWRSGNYSPIFDICVLDRSGFEKNGWARCGRSYFFGIFSDIDVDVSWRTSGSEQDLLD